MQTLSNRFSIQIGFNFMFNNERVNSWHFLIGPSKNISKFVENLSVCINFIGGTVRLDANISIFPGVQEMSIGIVGDKLSMFSSTNLLGAPNGTMGLPTLSLRIAL